MSTESMLKSIQAFSIQQNPDPNAPLVHDYKHSVRSFGFVNSEASKLMCKCSRIHLTCSDIRSALVF